MENTKRLKEINKKTENRLEEKNKLEIELQQLKNQEKKMRRQFNEKNERKENIG